MPTVPTLLCPQICALLFASLYILCHFIITHFKKHTDFTAGKRVGAANNQIQPPEGSSSSSLAFGLPSTPSPTTA